MEDSYTELEFDVKRKTAGKNQNAVGNQKRILTLGPIDLFRKCKFTSRRTKTIY